MKRTRTDYERPFLDVYAVARRYDVRHTTIWTWVREDRFPPPMRLQPDVSRWSIEQLRGWEAEKLAEAAKRPEWEERQRRKQRQEAKT